MRRVYFDYSATSPTRSEVAKIVLEYMTERFGNPSSLHSFGRETKQALEKARAQVAAAVNAHPDEVFFTSGGTEGDNLAVIGAAWQNVSRGRHVIASAIEHHAVLDACRRLENLGFEVDLLPVDQYGAVNPEELGRMVRPDTILVAVMHANNEVGTIQPVEEIGQMARERGILFHVDAVQTLGKIPVDVQEIKADLLVGSGHKIYGPKGTGFLYIRRGVNLQPLIYGGGQEQKVRPGTENLPGIAGLGLAAELVIREQKEEMTRLSGLRDDLIVGLTDRVPHARLNGHPRKRVANNVNMSFDHVEGGDLLGALDSVGIAASGGSACSAEETEPSHVLQAMGLNAQQAGGAVRMTLGRDTTSADIAYALEVIPPVIESLRKGSPPFGRHKKECAECALKK